MEVEDSLESTKRDPDIRKEVSQLANVDVSIRIIVHRGQYLLINLYIVLHRNIPLLQLQPIFDSSALAL